MDKYYLRNIQNSMTLEDEELLVKICVELEQHIYLNGENL